MGQSNSKEQWIGYNSKDYFRQQVEFYRWRADPLYNTHICKVFFQLQQTVRDKEKLKSFLQSRVSEADHISIGELMNLAKENENSSREELMNFENYVCTLHDLAERLNLQQVLYVLQVMFNGYQTLLSKVGKCRVELNCCFVTVEGQVRIWLNKDFKSNQVQIMKGQNQSKTAIITSQMSLIKKVLQLGQKLSSNHTQFLHFSRQFRSYMERDILQNWNFPNARKLINSYVYTYRINLPSSLKEVVKRVLKFSNAQSEKISLSQSQSYFGDPHKDQMMSTVSGFIKEHIISNQALRKDGQRPFCYSDHSNSKKSQSNNEHSLKSHSKKFSSTDLKNQCQRNKAFESPKMSRSQLLPNKSKQQFKSKEVNNMQFSSIQAQTQRIRRQRQFAKVGDKEQNKLYNFSTSVGFSPDTNSLIQGQNEYTHQNEWNQNGNSVLKQNQNTKQKKKLEKKVATISKYISYYQNQSNNNSKHTTSDIIQEQTVHTKSNIVHFASDQNMNLEDSNNMSSNVSMKINPKTTESKLCHKLSYQVKNIYPSKDSSVNKGKTEFNRSQCNSQHSDCSSNQDNSYPRICLTVQTINKLLQNNEVSLHESNGSFMSLQQGQGSEYSGVLCKMGRSVNILNAPSNKQVMNLQRKSNANSLNRSINY